MSIDPVDGTAVRGKPGVGLSLDVWAVLLALVLALLVRAGILNHIPW